MSISQAPSIEPATKMPARRVRQRYGITGRTLHRWRHKPELGFPAAISINNRWYFDESELLAWERKRTVMSCSAGKAELAKALTTQDIAAPVDDKMQSVPSAQKKGERRHGC